MPYIRGKESLHRYSNAYENHLQPFPTLQKVNVELH